MIRTRLDGKIIGQHSRRERSVVIRTAGVAASSRSVTSPRITSSAPAIAGSCAGYGRTKIGASPMASGTAGKTSLPVRASRRRSDTWFGHMSYRRATAFTVALSTNVSATLIAAEAMETAVSVASASVRAAKTALEGIVKIACPPSAIYFLMPFQEIVAKRYPGLGVELVSGRLPVDLAKGEADIAVRNARPTDLDLVIRHSFEWGSCVYAAQSSPLRTAVWCRRERNARYGACGRQRRCGPCRQVGT